MAPELVVARYGMPPVDVVSLGTTSVPIERFERFLREISPRFTAATYDLLANNCNNFSNELATFLLGTGIPQHILDLPNEALSTPLGYERPRVAMYVWRWPPNALCVSCTTAQCSVR